MDLKFLWEQAQIAKERENELNAAVAVCFENEREINRLKEIENDFQCLLRCIKEWSTSDGVYIDSEQEPLVKSIKEKYNV